MDADNERHDYRRRDSFRDADFQPPRRMQSRYLGDFDDDRYNSRSRVRSKDDGFKDASPLHDRQSARLNDRQSIVTSVQIPGRTSSPPLFQDFLNLPKVSPQIYLPQMDPFHMDSPDMDSPNTDPPPPSESLPAKRQRKLKFETFDFTGADYFQVQSDDDELYVEEADEGADIESVLGSTKEDHMEEVEGDEDDNDPDINADDEEPVQRHRQKLLPVRSSVRSAAKDEQDSPALLPVVWQSANPKPQSVSFQPLVQKANSKAGQLYNKPTARFRCPLVNCKIIMPETTTHEQLWEHASNKQHLLSLYNQDRYRCELGCKESFTDTLGRVYHYAMQKCRIDMLEDY
ncbi:hypothetical protein KCV07_g3724, partial [Aureobasidium melanogenum]